MLYISTSENQMSDPNHDTFEEHRRVIASLDSGGLANTIEQEYIKAANGKKSTIYKGLCPVCKESFISGFAVRCSDPSCAGKIYHQSCFGAHTLLVHQPRSITIIIKETDTFGTWEYVDADTVPFTLPTPNRIPTGAEIMMEEKGTPDEVITFHGPDDDSVIRQTSGNLEMEMPEDMVSAYDIMAQEKLGKTTRTKKRSNTKE